MTQEPGPGPHTCQHLQLSMTPDLEALLELLKKHNVHAYEHGGLKIQFAPIAFVTPVLENEDGEKKKTQGEANQEERALFYAAEG
jgi:hypothetical protein